MTTRLDIYNGALTYAGERTIASLAVNEEGRRLLDYVWNDNGVLACLERGQWKFAMRTAKLTPYPSYTREFGYQYAFEKGTDWVNTSAVCEDEYFRAPLLQYQDEKQFIFADIMPIYVRYISSDEQYGLNLGRWPSSFTEYVKAYFAGRIVLKLTGDESRDKRLNDMRSGLVQKLLIDAKNSDAMADPTKFSPPGQWNMARNGWGRGRGPFGDGGLTGSLTGG